MVEPSSPARPTTPPPRLLPQRVRRHPARTLLVALLVLLLGTSGALALRDRRDERLTLSAEQLDLALATFRPPDLRGTAGRLDATALTTEDQVQADPASCLALVRLATTGGLDAGTWTGVGGSPRQPVQLLSVRFADPAAARRELARKRTVLRRCDQVSLSFPPFDEPAARFTVHAEGRAWLPGDRLAYTLTSTDVYAFYLRRYGNTLTWSYANQTQTNDAPDGSVRRAVVDDLVTRLEEIVRG